MAEEDASKASSENRSSSTEEQEILLERINTAIESLHQVIFTVNNAKRDLQQVLLQFQSFAQLINRGLVSATSRNSPTLAIYQLCPRKEQSGSVGRPKHTIQEETLISFRHLGYTWNEIASMLLVSRWIIKRRVEELGIKEITGYSPISDEDLDQLILNFRQVHGSYVGRPLVKGHLISHGLRVQQWRIKSALTRIDPAGSRIRWACLVKRRKYSVPGPNSLWHLDGHHSFITWGFVIHGAIDGYFRMIVFLRCATNNRKEIVLDLFRMVTAKHGVPSPVRTDKGGENVLVWQEMESFCGLNRNSYLSGTSTRNQRIERLWRDVWMYVCHIFYYTFQGMEAEGVLDIDDDVLLRLLASSADVFLLAER
eukprot:gene2881-3333_t